MLRLSNIRYHALILVMGQFLFFANVSAQEKFNMEQYLSSALADQSLEQYQSQLEFLGDNNYNSPWLNKVEFRIGSQDANASLNQYRIRLGATNPGEIKANKGYYNQHVQNINHQHKIALNDALKNRYNLIVQLAYLQNTKASLDSIQGFQTQILKHLQSNVNQGIGFSDMLGLQSDQTDLLLDGKENESAISYTTFYISLDYQSEQAINWGNEKIISVEKIIDYIDQFKLEETHNLNVENAENKYALSEQKLRLEKAESWSNIGYIQTNIDTDRGSSLDEQLGFQLGVRIPIVNPKKPNINREKVELIKDKSKLQSTITIVKRQQDLNDLSLSQLIDQYNLIKERLALANNLSISNTRQIEWKDILKLKNYQYDLEDKKISLESQIRMAYISFLDYRGLLIQAPLINYLSNDFNPIEQ